MTHHMFIYRVYVVSLQVELLTNCINDNLSSLRLYGIKQFMFIILRKFVIVFARVFFNYSTKASNIEGDVFK